MHLLGLASVTGVPPKIDLYAVDALGEERFHATVANAVDAAVRGDSTVEDSTG